MPTLKVTGSNPYTFEFVPSKKTDEVVKFWSIEKKGANKCVGASVSAVRGTEKVVKYLSDFVQGAAQKTISKNYAQKIELTLNCGNCEADTYAVEITAEYASAAKLQVRGQLKEVKGTGSITCLPAGSEGAIDLAFVSNQMFIDSDAFALLTADAIESLGSLERELTSNELFVTPIGLT